MTGARQADQSSATSTRPHLVGLDGLRGIAAVTVMTGHVYQHLSPDVAGSAWSRALLSQMGQGLTLFFALSGFLLYLPFMRGLYSGRSAPSTRQFYFNRLVRIYPAHLVVLLVSSYLLAATYNTSPPTDQVGVDGQRGMLEDPGQIVANVLLVQTLIPSTMGTGLGVSWSLTTELCFYLVLPILAALALRLFRNFRNRDISALAPPVALFLMGVIANLVADMTRSGTPQEQYAASWGPTWHAVFERSLIAQATLFATGMAAAVLVARLSVAWVERGSRIRPYVLMAAIVSAMGAALAPPTLMLSLASAALIAATVLPGRTGEPGLLARVLESRPLYGLGLVSYSFYLWHAMVINVIRDQGLTLSPGSAWGFAAHWVLVLAVTLVLAVLTYVTIERPCMRLRRRT